GLGPLGGGRPSLDAGVTELAHGGGWLGVLVGGGLYRTVGVAGALVILLALLIVALIITTGIGLRALASATGALLRGVGGRFASWWTSREKDADDEDDEEEVDDLEGDYDEFEYESEPELFEYEEETPDEVEPENEMESLPPPPARAAARRRPKPVMAGEWELPPLSVRVRTKDQKEDRRAD